MSDRFHLCRDCGEPFSCGECDEEFVHASFAEEYLRKLDRDARWLSYAATLVVGILIGWWLA